MNLWHTFLATFYKEKRAIHPNYTYRQAMEDGKGSYLKFKIDRKKIRKELGAKIHLIRDPLNYVMAEYLNTYDKISLKSSSDMFRNVKLNIEDCKLLYSDHKQKIKEKKHKDKAKKMLISLETFRIPAYHFNNCPAYQKLRYFLGIKVSDQKLRLLLAGDGRVY